MLIWLAPLALAGLALLALPVLIHLFTPRKVRVTPFSSLRWLRQTQHKLSRRIRLHQILLFLLRVAIITLLVLALARPLFTPGGTGKATERFIVLDVSRSMGYRAQGRATPIELARQVAAQLLSHNAGDDRAAVILVSTSAHALGPLVRDPEIYLPQLESVPVTDGDTRLASALPLIRSMLAQRRPDTDAEIFFVTDNHQNSWAETEIREFQKGLDGKVRVRLVDVGMPNAGNGWIASARLLDARKSQNRLIRIQLGCAESGAQQRTVRLGGLAGLPEQSRPVWLEPDKLARVDFELPAGYDLAGRVARLQLEPADALPSDDTYLLNLDTRGGLTVVLVEGDVTQIESLRPGFHLWAALGALSVSQANSIDLVRRTPADLTAGDLTGAAIVILADVPTLPDAMLSALHDRVRDGAGLVVFLGPSLQKDFYNTRLFNPLAPADSLLPVTLQGPVKPVAQLTTLADVRWNHTLLAGLYDPVLGDLRGTKFNTFYQLQLVPDVTADILARFEGGMPAVLDHPLGAGRVMVFNTTANDLWSDLPRRKSFVPLIDRLVDYLAGGGTRRMFEVGETVTLALTHFEAGQSVEVVSPNGAVITPDVRTTGGKTLLHLGMLQQAGVYIVKRTGAPEVPFVVQAGRGDSVLTPVDVAVLKQWWSPLDFAALTPAQVTGEKGMAQRSNLAPWLVLLGALVLLTEMYFVHRLCPRITKAPPHSLREAERVA